MLVFFITKNNEEEAIIRRVYTFTDAMSAVGGLFGVIVIVCKVIMKILVYFYFEKSLARRLFLEE